MNQITKHIHRNIVRLRNEHGLNDAQLARLAGLNRSDVSRYTNGHVCNPKFDFLEKLCSALGVSLLEVLGLVPMSDNPYSGSERAHIMRLRQMNDADRDVVERMVKALTD